MSHTEKEKMPSGDGFMPGTSLEDLRQKHKTERDHKAAGRLLASIKRKEGMPIRDIAKSMEKSYTTIHDWLTRMHESGPAARHDKSRPGRACKLSEAQLVQLSEDLVAGPQECGFESGVWTSPLVVRHVKKKYGILYEARGMYDLLHRLGFSCRRPRPRHPKAASRAEKDAFKKKQARSWRATPKKAT